MSCGLACVGTDIGGIRELITDRINGLLFKPDDSAAFTEALQSLLNDNSLAAALGAKARQTIKIIILLSVSRKHMLSCTERSVTTDRLVIGLFVSGHGLVFKPGIYTRSITNNVRYNGMV